MTVKYQWQKEKENLNAAYKAAREDLKRWQKMVAAQEGYQEGDPRLHADFIQARRTNQSTVLQGVRFDAIVVKVPFRTGRVGSGFDKDAVHYQVKLWIDNKQNQAFVFEYSQGSLVRQWPTLREILNSFLQDAVIGTDSFMEYCANFGADSDSRKAYKLHEYCVLLAEWLAENYVYETKLHAMCQQLAAAEDNGDINVDPPQPTDDGELPF